MAALGALTPIARSHRPMRLEEEEKITQAILAHGKGRETKKKSHTSSKQLRAHQPFTSRDESLGGKGSFFRSSAKRFATS